MPQAAKDPQFNRPPVIIKAVATKELEDEVAKEITATETDPAEQEQVIAANVKPKRTRKKAQ